MITSKRLVVISDFQDGPDPISRPMTIDELQRKWASSPEIYPRIDIRVIKVTGSYLERLPLACLKCGLVDTIELWSHWRGDHPPPPDTSDPPIVRRFFQMNGPTSPFMSDDMLAYIRTFGAPDILCVWGLGVDEKILSECSKSFKIYNSIDAPAMRIPFEVSRHFDLILTGAQWQSDEVHDRHPSMLTTVLPVGPEFASGEMFHPLETPKPYDLVYVAAAQGYKRHDILFTALEKLPRSIRALCVMGYGEMGDILRDHARDLGLNVDFVGPPGVHPVEVNRLMNMAKIGVVCGVNDGAPAILTEYMLAGLPVLANSQLSCGLQYIRPDTGMTAPAELFHDGIERMLASLSTFSPRQAVLDNWAWPHSVDRLKNMLGYKTTKSSGTKHHRKG